MLFRSGVNYMTPRDLEEKQLNWEEGLEAFHNSQEMDFSLNTAGKGAS